MKKLIIATLAVAGLATAAWALYSNSAADCCPICQGCCDAIGCCK